jgi:hypothetical protein
MNSEKISKIAEECHFNIYNSPIWKGTGERFVEAIIRECADVANKTVIGSDKVGDLIKEHFGLE